MKKHHKFRYYFLWLILVIFIGLLIRLIFFTAPLYLTGTFIFIAVILFDIYVLSDFRGKSFKTYGPLFLTCYLFFAVGFDDGKKALDDTNNLVTIRYVDGEIGENIFLIRVLSDSLICWSNDQLVILNRNYVKEIRYSFPSPKTEESLFEKIFG